MVDLVESGLRETQSMIMEISPHAKTTLYKADISDEDSVKAMISKCVETYGRLDFACNNAGIAMGNISTTETDLKTFDKIHNVNFRGVGINRNGYILGVELAETCRSIFAKNTKLWLCSHKNRFPVLNGLHKVLL
jgi:NAD(P)-dependent dehydrogenase (short-subunit alcohol dehydrogenase family)